MEHYRYYVSNLISIVVKIKEEINLHCNKLYNDVEISFWVDQSISKLFLSINFCSRKDI